MLLESVESDGDVIQLRLDGRLDIAGSEEISNRFAFVTTARSARITVDLSAVTFIASIGLRLLLISAQAQARRGGKLILAAPQPGVRQVLEAASIDHLVAIFPTVESARASLSNSRNATSMVETRRGSTRRDSAEPE